MSANLDLEINFDSSVKKNNFEKKNLWHMQHFDTRCNFSFDTQWVETISETALLFI